MLFANQRALEPDKLRQYAKDVGLDVTEFNACLDTGKYRAEVAQDAQDGQVAGVTGTPAFFINGRFLSGVQAYETFAKIIDEELESKGITR